MRKLAAVLGFMILCLPVMAQDAPRQIPIGITNPLADLQATVGYKLFDQEPVILGPGWIGYDQFSGIYFTPEIAADGTSQVFMHCPWAAGKGVAFAEYNIALPATEQAKLKFDIGLRSGATGSDGVTYRVYVNDQLLFEKHHTARSFTTYEVDLAPFVDRIITLRFEVDPGPERNTSDDWSMWRNIELLVGNDSELTVARQKAEAEAARRRAEMLAHAGELANLSLDGLTSHVGASACPSVAAPTQLSANAEGNIFTFRCVGAGDAIEYRFDAEKGLWNGLTVTANGKLLNPAPFTGGPVVHLDGKDFNSLSNSVPLTLLSAKLEGLRLSCEYLYTNPETGSGATLHAVMWPENKSLGLDLTGEPDRFSGFAAYTNGGVPVTTTFGFGGQILWRNEGVYLSTVLDLMRSDASGVGSMDHTAYLPLTNGIRNAMRDRFYVSVSSRYEEVIPNLINAPSPYLDELAHRTVLDGWGGSFAENEQWLRDMSRYGVDSFLMIKHVWQRDGYDMTYPNTIPANASMGGDEALRSLSLTAQALGHRFNVHENYYDYYPNAEAFKEADQCLTPEGKPIAGWDNGQVRAVILKPSKLMDYVYDFTPQIQQRYACDSAYHDIMPTWHVDFDAAVPGAGKIRYTHEQTRELCNYDRDIYGGPVVFEAADPMTAGLYDGGCNNGIDTYKFPVAVAAELLKIHPRMSNHGFGYYERWLTWGYGPGWYTYVMTDRELDKYRAYQTAFGRTGFIGQQLMKHPHGVVREFYLTQGYGRAYTGKLVKRIRYEIDGQWVDAGTASRLGVFTRLNTEFEDGQQVYVNLSDSPWKISGYELPQFGTLTLGPRAQTWTALRDGQICDYSEYGNVIYADARSDIWDIPEPPASITPVAQFTDLGGGEFELGINWTPERKLDKDYTSFWHFINSRGIAFQNDHTPVIPTSQWQVGETVTDGPVRIAIPEDATSLEYEVRVGLYNNEGRITLVHNSDQALVGKLIIIRDGARAVKVEFTPAVDVALPGTDPSTYREGANLEKKIINFGEVSTNGAVVLRKTMDGREVIPVPLGEIFTIGLSGNVQSVTPVDAKNQALPAPSLTSRDGKTWFETSAAAVLYRIF